MHSFGFKLVVFFAGFYLIIRFYQLIFPGGSLSGIHKKVSDMRFDGME